MTSLDTDLPIIGQTQEPGDGFGWKWSQEACLAFYNGAMRGAKKGAMKIGHGLSAALLVDGAALFQTQLERLVTHLVTHPVLADRVMVFKPSTPGGDLHLKVDETLIRFVLFNELPAQAEARMVGDGAQEMKDNALAEDIAKIPAAALEGDDDFGGHPNRAESHGGLTLVE